MGGDYDTSQESSYLQYLNANNPCGWAMSQPLPTCRFKWVDIQIDEISGLAKLKIKGYLLEVDISYPSELHDSHNDLPFMCEKMVIGGVEKLVPNLRDKKNYVIHIRALDQALKHGLVLEQIHRAIEFNQYPWMKTYIDCNTKLRMAAANDFEKDFFKLMNNAVFGKTMENIRKHKNFKLVTSEAQYLKTVMKPNFKSGVRFDENLMGCEMGRIKVVMNKLVYLGQAILDLSKIVMYEFHYDCMTQRYSSDRLNSVTWIQTLWFIESRLRIFMKTYLRTFLLGLILLGIFQADLSLPIGLNKKVIGLMKDELVKMTEFIALRPKLYSYKVLDGAESKKCKGIKKCVIKKTLTFEDYKACLFNSDTIYRSQLMFRSIKHEIFTLEVNKVALNRDDDKRISKKDGISTLARGHKSLSWSPILGELSLI